MMILDYYLTLIEIILKYIIWFFIIWLLLKFYLNDLKIIDTVLTLAPVLVRAQCRVLAVQIKKWR